MYSSKDFILDEFAVTRHNSNIKDEPKPTSSPRGGIMVTIKTREGLCIQKKGLDYQGLKTLVEKVEGI